MDPNVLTEAAHLSLGARFMGATMNIALEGFVLSQCWHYYYHFHQTDARWLQILVGTIVAFTLAQTIALWQFLWECFIDNFGNVPYVSTVPFGLGVTAGFTAVLGFLIQGYFVRRCYYFLNRTQWYSKAFLALFVPLLAFILVDGIVICVLVTKPMTDFSSIYLNSVTYTYSSWMVISTFVDVSTSAILFYKLQSAHNRTSFEDTKNTIMRMVLLIVNSCFLSTGLMIVTTILYFVYKDINYYISPYECISKVHAMSMLVQLSGRNVPGAASSFTEVSSRKTGAISGRRGQQSMAIQLQSQDGSFEKGDVAMSTLKPELSGIRVNTATVIHKEEDDVY